MSPDDPPARIPVGLEREPVESPCPGCGAYFFDLHADGCAFEEPVEGAWTHWERDDND
jgi:hypothetical protein